jgi:regulator of sigma E protease
LPDFLTTLLVFIAVLGVLIFVHELGHFTVAKWLGIRVEVFSLGIGSRVAGFRRGGTDYRISMLPIGGYVKMAGEHLGDEVLGLPDEFLSHPKWHRFLVAIAGPVMNILLALAIPMVSSMVYFEEDEFESLPARVGRVAPDGAAALAGLTTGDVVVAFDGTAIPTWRDLRRLELLHPDQDVVLTVERAGQRIDLTAHTAGVLTDQQVRIGYLGIGPTAPEARHMVVRVERGWPAEEAGLQVGDQILAVNGSELAQDDQGERARMIQSIQNSGANPVTLRVRHPDGTIADITAVARQDPELNVARLGFVPDWSPKRIVTRKGLTEAAAYSLETNVGYVTLTATALGQIFKGTRSARDALSGPIGIYDASKYAYQAGYTYLLDLMGLLSLNLGIFNLLPIPVLDGGLILMLGLEAMLGWFGLTLTVSMKEKMINVGLVFIILLMGFVFFNDIQKKWLSSPPAGPSPPATTQPAPAK